MATLYLTEQGSKLKKEGRRLIVEKEGERLLDVPLIKIDSVLITSHCEWPNLRVLTTGISP